MKVLYLSFEVAPIYKTGGLGDVAGSLPKALKKIGVDMSVSMPLYKEIQNASYLPGTKIPLIMCGLPYFSTTYLSPEGSKDMHFALMYAQYAQLVLDTVKKQGQKYDIIHLNDWHPSFVPFLLKTQKDDFFASTKTILTIHNPAYQGSFPVSFFSHNKETAQLIDMLSVSDDKVNFLATGITYADWITTVSPHFAQELESGKNHFGLHKILHKRRRQFGGILNGIDYDLFNRASDQYIHKSYGVDDVAQGKMKNKVWLQKKLKLDANPACALFGVVSRLDRQKGFDILAQIMKSLVKQDVQFVVQGTGDPKITKLLERAAKMHKGKVLFVNEFNEELAHQIYAASDFFLIPSVFEPCGLTQMIAMTYGAIPIAANVGGLHDTITDGQTGFLFKKHTVADFLEACERALDYWHDPVALHYIRQRCLKQDFSWDKSAKEYKRLYKKVIIKGR